MSDRYRPPRLEELVDGDVAELRHVDSVLRRVPAPPLELPRSLREPLAPPADVVPLWTRRRVLLAVAVAAALAALFFGVGMRVGGNDGFAEVRSYEMRPTADGRGATATLRVGERDDAGNRAVRLESAGLPKLPEGGYYVLWLEQDGEYAGTCGTFVGGDAEWTVSYDLWEYDAWIVSAHLPGSEPDEATEVLKLAIS